MTDQRKPLGVGVVSLGWMGKLHARSYLAAAEKFPELPVKARLVVAADPIEANQTLATDVLGFEKATTDVDAVINDPDVDIVSICSPNFLHKEFALKAAAVGKPFWIEKPMGVSADESKEILDAVEAKGLITAVGFNYRHAPAVEYARKLIRSGEIGEVTNIRCWFLADYSSDPSGVHTWRFVRRTSGSGVLGDLLSHGFDLAEYMAGTIIEVNAMTKTIFTERPEPAGAGATSFARNDGGTMRPVENEDYAAVMARFANGAVGVFESSRVANGPRAEYVIEVYGTNGSIRWNFEEMNVLEVAYGQRMTYGYTRLMVDPTMPYQSHFQPGAGTSMGFDDLKTIEAVQFLQSVHEGRQLAPSVADGLAAARIAHAADDSARDGAWHAVPAPEGRITFDA